MLNSQQLSMRLPCAVRFMMVSAMIKIVLIDGERHTGRGCPYVALN